jgi:hypothetical protein
VQVSLHTQKFKPIPSLCPYLLTDFFDLKLLTPPLKQMLNVDIAGFLPSSLCSQSALEWRGYFSARGTPKETESLCDENFSQHFSCDKMVYNTYCDIPKEYLVTKTSL